MTNNYNSVQFSPEDMAAALRFFQPKMRITDEDTPEWSSDWISKLNSLEKVIPHLENVHQLAKLELVDKIAGSQVDGPKFVETFWSSIDSKNPNRLDLDALKKYFEGEVNFCSTVAKEQLGNALDMIISSDTAVPIDAYVQLMSRVNQQYRLSAEVWQAIIFLYSKYGNKPEFWNGCWPTLGKLLKPYPQVCDVPHFAELAPPQIPRLC